MNTIASTLVNWSALLKIVLAALIGGSGVVLAFGILLLGLKWATGAKGPGAKIGGYSLAGICAVFCTAAVVIGIYAMAEKPSSKKPAPKPKPAAALIAPSSRST